jgi:hypothetical protein
MRLWQLNPRLVDDVTWFKNNYDCINKYITMSNYYDQVFAMVQQNKLSKASMLYIRNLFLDGTLCSWQFIVLHLFANRNTLHQTVIDPDLNEYKKNRLIAILACKIYSTLPMGMQGVLSANQLYFEHEDLMNIAKSLMKFMYYDYTAGGGLIRPLTNVKYPRLDPKTSYPCKRTLAKMYSITNIKRYIKRASKCNLADARRQKNHIHCPGYKHFASQLPSILIYQLSSEIISEHPVSDGKRRGVSTYGCGLSIVSSYGFSNHADRKPIQKRTMKSYKFACSILGEKTVKAFINNDGPILQLPVAGTTLYLTVERVVDSNIHILGHGSLSIDIHDTSYEQVINSSLDESVSIVDDTVCGLCVYFKDMPMLDQLAVIALYCNSGDIQDLIDSGNVTEIEDGPAKNHPIIVNRLAKPVTIGEDLPITMQRYMRRENKIYRSTKQTLDEFYDKYLHSYAKFLDVYFNEMKDVWYNILLEMFYHRNAPKIKKFIEEVEIFKKESPLFRERKDLYSPDSNLKLLVDEYLKDSIAA